MLQRIGSPVLLGLLLSSAAFCQSEETSARQQTNSTGSAVSRPMEDLLREKSRVTISGEQTMSIGEVLDQISSEHHIHVRLHRDVVNLMSAVLEQSVIPSEDYAKMTRQSATNAQTISQPSGTLPRSGTLFRLEVVPLVQVSSPPVCSACQTSLPNATYLLTSSADGHYPPYPQGASTNVPAEGAPPAGIILPAADVKLPEPLPPSSVKEAPAPNPPTAYVEKPGSTPTGEPAVEADDEPNLAGSVHALGAYAELFRQTKVSTAPLRGNDLTVEELLQRLIEQIATPFDTEGDMTGLPVAYSHAYDWDLLVQGHDVFISTRMQANTYKYVKVYRLPRHCDITTEEFNELIRRTIRPWSWRDRIDDVVNMVQIEIPEGAGELFNNLPKIKKIDLTGSGEVVQFEQSENADQSEATVTENEASIDPELAWKSLKALGSLISSGTIATAHGLLSATEIMHYADLPTGTVEELPGMLVISQSRGAHREIADLIQRIEAASVPVADPE